MTLAYPLGSKPLSLLLIAILIQPLLNGCSSMSQTDNKTASADSVLSAQDSILEATREILKSQQELEVEALLLPQPHAQSQPQTAEHDKNKVLFNNVWKRIPSLYQLSDINNKKIDTQKNWDLKHKIYIERISKRATPFLYLITDEVDKRNMPGEIILLPIIESAFKTTANSPRNASGLWQFVPATGRYFGLKQTPWYDGRRDVYKSTDAALTYLTQLNKYYKGDWLLALAAYNAGAGRVNKAIKKNRKKGKPVDYWSLDLPKETRLYIPKLLAMAKIVQYADQYDVALSPVKNQPHLKLVNIKSQIDLTVAAKISGISLAEIQTYNPAFNQWATDPNGPYHLLLPVETAARFEEKLALLSEEERIPLHRHKIHSGESLSVIAQQYHISVKALKQVNKLSSSRIRAGKYLLIPPTDDVYNIASNNNYTSSIKQLSNKRSSNKQSTVKKNTYTVRKGDSFWTIARHFNLPHKKLAAINGLSSGDTLSIGQILITKYSAQARAEEAIIYKVRHGDSLYLISKKFNVTINDLKLWNGLRNKKYLQPGQKLTVHLNNNS